jgi:hypothetical protein
VLAPMYIAEVSPAGIRGRLVTLNQMAIVNRNPGRLLCELVPIGSGRGDLALDVRQRRRAIGMTGVAPREGVCWGERLRVGLRSVM